MSCLPCSGSSGKEAKSLEALSPSPRPAAKSAPVQSNSRASGSRKEDSVPVRRGGNTAHGPTQIFTFRELAIATKNFRKDCLLGEGGFGRVYKGRMENGQVIAVKQLDRNGFQGNREFLVEVLMLSLLHHPNLVRLIGYCADGDQRLLVYEYMVLGSLENHLYDCPPDKEPLDWNTRMKIAAGAARGLEYLHDKANPPVIYRDFKSSNILLGEDYYPKLSDFGLAKLGPVGDKTHVSTRVMGTYGYCAPEYALCRYAGGGSAAVSCRSPDCFRTFVMACRRPACFVVAAILLLVAVAAGPRPAAAKEYAAIFNFGDSLVDAGNLVVDGIPDHLATARLPYGMTHFGYPTGRCSDGRLVIDFIAQELGLPLLPPSKAKNATFHRGANFAITGATSLDTPFFVARGLGHTVWNSGSLHTQIKWFQDMKPKLCGSSPPECRDLFRRSLFVVGEFGGNDYNSPLFAFRPLADAYDFIPHVVDSIAEGVEKLIAEGAVDLVVPGVLPIGCFPVYLSIFRKQPEGYGPRSGCIREMNTLSWVHNAALQRKIVELRAKHPDVRIIYADYYTPAIQFVLHAEKYGFLQQKPRACCGAPGVGEYNFNLTSKCGEPGAFACEDPSNHWSWDGIHLTEASYGHIAKGWLYGPFADPPILGNKHLG